MRTCAFIALAVAVVNALTNPVVEAASVSSTFDSGSEGWMVADIRGSNPDDIDNPPEVLTVYTPTFDAVGGNPGGFISMTDPSGNWFWFDAPAKFLGDKSSAFNGSVSFDIRLSASNGAPYSALMLVGPSMTLHYVTMPPADTFTTFAIPLSPTGWKINNPYTGIQPTDVQMQEVLTNLGALRINGDWFSGYETAGLDNVVLSSPVPVPGAMILGSLGVGLVGWLRRRRVL